MRAGAAAPALAAAAWWGAWVGWLWPAHPSAVTVAVVLPAGLAMSRPAVRPVAVVLLVAAAVAGLGAIARQVPEPLVERAVSVEARVVAPPRQVPVDLGAPPALSVAVQVNRIQLGTTAWHVDLPGRVFADVDDYPVDAVPGTTLAARARVLSPSIGDTNVGFELLTAGRVVAAAGPVAATVQRLRAGLAGATTSGQPDAAALVAGIALGDESGQSPELAQTMQVSGLSHLTAVSGGNFVIVMGGVLFLARWRRAPLPAQVFLAASTVIGYGIVVGPQPSVLRAATMATAGLVGVLMGGRSRGLAVLSGCVTALLVVSPDLARSLGFALSVAATAGLQLLVAPSGRLLGRVVPGRLALAVSVTVVAHLVTAPLLVLTGAAVSWVAVPANLAVAPLVAIITVLGLAAAVAGMVYAPAAVLVGVPAVILARIMLLVAHIAQSTAAAPWGVRLGQGLVAIIVAAMVWAVGIRAWGARVRLPVLGMVVVACATFLRSSLPPSDWRLIVCDVGQGTAVLARTDSGAVLFDSGPASGDASSCLNQAGVGDLAAVVVSHFHADHVAGLPQVLVSRRAEQVLVPAGAAASSTNAAVHHLLRADAIPSAEVVAGDSWHWGDVSATVLWPPAGRRFSTDEANNGSLVVVLEWSDGFRLLLPGDAEPESQAQIMRMWTPGPMDVTVMPHHGSDHQDPGFAAWTHPALAVASVGEDNGYGHPAPGTMAEYATVGAIVRRTDQDGPVVISVRDGEVLVG